MSSLSDIPVEVLLDNILPFFSFRDIASLGSTNRFFALLTSDDTFWKRKLNEDFNFPDADTARTTGWKFIYKGLRDPRVFVWGEKSNGRLGMTSFPKSTVPDIPFPVRLRLPHVRVVSLVAGGMSFHSLDSRGDVYVWGTLDGTSSSLASDGFSEASKSTTVPLKLQLSAATRSISCGRLHSMTLDMNSHIWTFLNWGRPFRLASHLVECKSPDTTPIQIECGWSFCSVLTKSGNVLVYFPFANPIQARYEEEMQVLDQERITMAHAVDGQIPCHTWDLEISPVLLPPLPSLPNLPHTGLDEKQTAQETRLIKIAGMDRSLVGLTNKGHVVKFDGLINDEIAGQSWRYLPLFSEVDKVKAHPVFSASDKEGFKPKIESDNMLVTHISANFQTFFAYSTGSTSIVLMGSVSTAPPNAPTVIPELQNKSIISVVLGDYHYGALSSSGALYTWGAYSKGALGLGDPTQLEPGSPGGFATETQRLRAIEYRFGVPPNVEVPTQIRFDHGLKESKKRFCFGAAAAGWHFGALVIDLEKTTEEDQVPLEEIPEVPPRFGHTRGWGGGVGIFRVGYAGRGMLPRGGLHF